jgi:hypothetical protein
MSDADLIDLYNERSAIRYYDGITSSELDRMTDAERERWRIQCDQDAYYDLRRLVGRELAMPAEIVQRARKFGSYDEPTAADMQTAPDKPGRAYSPDASE